MHNYASFNHKIFPTSEINISAISSAGLYGKGVFTTLAIRDSKPLLWNKHWERLERDSDKLSMDLSDFHEKEVENSLGEIIAENNISTGRCRVTFFDESPTRIWRNPSEKKISLLIQTADSKAVKDKFSLTVSPFSINSKSSIAGIKSCNYLENILALENAKSQGFDEAVRLNEKGEIASSCMANIFWRRDGRLFTPSLKTGCLAGTTREHIIDTEDVFEVEETLEALANVEEILLTSAGIGRVKSKLRDRSAAT